MEFENVKEALKYLLEVNQQGGDMKVARIDSDGTRHEWEEATLEDYKESNRETVYAICDMLGLENIYLDGKAGK